MHNKMNFVDMYFEPDSVGRKRLVYDKLHGNLQGKQLEVRIHDRGNRLTSGIHDRENRLASGIYDSDGSWDDTSGTTSRVFPVFQQKAGIYNEYSEYMTHHGCACSSLTTLLAAYVPEYRFLRPDETIRQVERNVFSETVWRENYSKPMARQMPVSLYGISCILRANQVAHRYIGTFTDDSAMKEIAKHLFRGKTVVIETSRMKRKNGRVVRWFDKKYAGSYHTMILLGIDQHGQVIFTDSATREWAGERQRIKWTALSDLIDYMFPQKNVEDTHVYFSKRKNTGGYILIDE